MHRIPFLSTLFAVALALVLVGCDSTGPNDATDDEPLDVITVNDLAADPLVNFGSGRPSGTGKYTFYSLRDDELILSYSADARGDSASTQWDIALQGTNILINGGTSGPGQGGGYVAEAAFEEVTEVDTNRLTVDDASAGTFAISPGSGNGWYLYNANGNNLVQPIPGRTLVIRAADGESYAKIRIRSYYEGAPDDPASSDAPSRHYTFDYVIQANGSTSLDGS